MSKALILKNSTLLQLYARAEAPNRDYYGLTIAESCICFNIWKVTRGPQSFPRQKFMDVEDFKYDKYVQQEIKNAFGTNAHEYILNLSNRKRMLENMPQKIFLTIAKYLSVNDILKLSRTNKIFYELCNTEFIWEEIFRKILRRPPSAEEKMVALDYGWKEALKRRLIYVRKAAVARAIKTQTTVTQSRSVNSVAKKSSSIVAKKTMVIAK